MARRAVELAPKKPDYWSTLGAAQYRADEWSPAIEAQDYLESTHPCDRLILYTDGGNEAQNAAGEEFSIGGLDAAIEACRPHASQIIESPWPRSTTSPADGLRTMTRAKRCCPNLRNTSALVRVRLDVLVSDAATGERPLTLLHGVSRPAGVPYTLN